MNFFLGPLLGDFYERILLEIGVAAILAVSLNIVNGFTGQFSIGHAGFMTLGGYAAGALTYYVSLYVWGDAAPRGGPFGIGEWLFAGACLAGGLIAACAGWLVGLPALRLRGDYLAIATLGFGEIVRVLLQQTNPVIYGRDELRAAGLEELIPPPLGGALGFSGVPKYTNLFWVYAALSITAIAAVRLKHSSTGRAMISIREDEIAAQVLGVNVTKLKVRAFMLSAFFAGIAGGLFAHESGVIISPKDAGFQRSFDIVIMAVLGGRGSVSGVIVAASILTLLPEFLRTFDQYRLIVYALLLIGMMLLRPQGLFGIKEIWDYIPRRFRATKAPA
jgi:branched-chain amino acid transport system permease protein